MTAGVVLEVRELTARRADAERRFELHVPSLLLSAGQRVAVVAPSGSGKSTLLDTIACARAPDHAACFTLHEPGGVLSDGTAQDGLVDVLAAWRRRSESGLARIRARLMGYVHQRGGLFGFLTVAENIGLALRLAGIHDPGRAGLLAGQLGIADLMDTLPAALSVGQRQRVAIARALAHRPPLVLADEPTAALDPDRARDVMAALCDMADQHGTALLVASHDRPLLERFGFTLLTIQTQVPAGTRLRALVTPLSGEGMA
ncbi:ABC transporter ATP-binding protein [Niveispirillum irakense]|uniref:ABC transporter ATP-binding protein n=1 Tax=Niveispirillum irakense TaxID=34011 RepID=UPI00068904AC|nr:ATP-binding cassette domain-containing protein [Niveispirillum irakense]